MADTESSQTLSTSDINSVYPGDITQSRDGHMIFSSGAIKQENGLLGKGSCTGSGSLASLSNGYTLGLPASAKDPTWAFKDTLLYNGQHQQDRASPIQGYGTHSGALDWTTASQASSPAARSSHYYPSSLSTHSHTPAGYSPYTGWDTAAAQAAYSPYNMPTTHSAAYRQTDTTGSCGYSPYNSSGSSSYSNGLGPIKPELTSPPTIQDMDQERSIRRARRNRTCFSKYQLERLEEVFRESKYPDVYRREEIAAQLDIKEEVVRVWFKNRRAKLKRDVKDHKPTTTNGSRASSDSGSPRSTTSSTPTQPIAPKESRSPFAPFPVPVYSSPLPYTSNGAFSSISANEQKSLPKSTLGTSSMSSIIPSTIPSYGSESTGLSGSRNLSSSSDLNSVTMATSSSAYRNMMSAYGYNGASDLNQSSPHSLMPSNLNLLPGGVTVTHNEGDVTPVIPSVTVSTANQSGYHDLMVSHSSGNLPRNHIAQSAFSVPHHYKSKSLEERSSPIDHEAHIHREPIGSHITEGQLPISDAHYNGNDSNSMEDRSAPPTNNGQLSSIPAVHVGNHGDFEELGPDDLSGEESPYDGDE